MGKGSEKKQIFCQVQDIGCKKKRIFFRCTANLHISHYMTSSSSVRVWYKSVCNALSAILSPHQPQRAVITRPPNPPEQIYCNEFYVVSGHSDFGTKFQDKRCFRRQRIGHWAGNCRAPWPVTYRPNRSGLPTPPTTIDPEK